MPPFRWRWWWWRKSRRRWSVRPLLLMTRGSAQALLPNFSTFFLHLHVFNIFLPFCYNWLPFVIAFNVSLFTASPVWSFFVLIIFTKAPVWLIVYIGRENMLENGLSPQFCISWPLPCYNFSQPYFQDQSPFFSIWCFFVCGGCSWAQTLFLLISPMGNGHHLLRLYRPIFYRFSCFIFLLIFLTFIVDFCLSSQV